MPYRSINRGTRSKGTKPVNKKDPAVISVFLAIRANIVRQKIPEVRREKVRCKHRIKHVYNAL